MAERKDILSEPTERKEEIYKLIDDLVRLFDFPVFIKEDKSGFPAMTVDCGGIHILTDILSLEGWWARAKERKQTARNLEIRMLTASELRQIADIMDNPNLPEGTEHNPDMEIRPKMFTTPTGKLTLEVCFLKQKKGGKVDISEKDDKKDVTNNEALCENPQ
jgi:hypothetical protein